MYHINICFILLRGFDLLKGGNTLKKVYMLLLIFCILNIVDYYSTILGLSQGATEANLIARYFLDHNALHYFKLFGVGLLCIYLIHASKRNLKSQVRVTRLMWWSNLAYSIICVSNIAVYFVQKNS